MKYLIYGLGEEFENCRSYIDGEIVGYVDGKKMGGFLPTGERILSLREGLLIDFDKIIVSSTDYIQEIWEALEKAGVENHKIGVISDFVTEEAFLKKYQSIISKQARQEKKKPREVNCVYVVTEVGIESGGPELLHQLVYVLNKNGFSAKIAYVNSQDYMLEECIPKQYLQYVQDSVVRFEDIDDISANAVVIPETKGELLSYFKNVFVLFWWLSVDNFWKKTSESIINNIYLKVDMHLYQSEYSRNFLEKLNFDKDNMMPLSDYINDYYLSVNGDQSQVVDKEDLIAFNPKKGWMFTHKLMMEMKEYLFVPISRMSVKQVADILRRSKVYIDFGNHPGKDRIPREAAIMGCCVVTGRKGAAYYDEDVPILSCYKVDEKSVGAVDEACTIIRECMKNYTDESVKFDDYRKRIKGEKDIFEYQVIDLMNYLVGDSI